MPKEQELALTSKFRASACRQEVGSIIRGRTSMHGSTITSLLRISKRLSHFILWQVSTDPWICQFRLRRAFCSARCPYWSSRNGNPDHTRVRWYSKCSLQLLSLVGHCSYHPQSGQTIAVLSPSVSAFPCWATFFSFLRGVNSMA
jgi:hypothetical protein